MAGTTRSHATKDVSGTSCSNLGRVITVIGSLDEVITRVLLRLLSVLLLKGFTGNEGSVGVSVVVRGLSYFFVRIEVFYETFLLDNKVCVHCVQMLNSHIVRIQLKVAKSK